MQYNEQDIHPNSAEYVLLNASNIFQTYLNRLILEDRDRQIDEVRRKYENDEDRSQEEVMRIEQETVSLQETASGSLHNKFSLYFCLMSYAYILFWSDAYTFVSYILGRRDMATLSPNKM